MIPEDVYKRQFVELPVAARVRQGDSDTGRSHRQQRRAGHCTHHAVSYTHLDVYKRQALFRVPEMTG